jgi:multiple sugar transport system permease protein
MVPEEVTIIPNFYLIRWMGVMDTQVPLILLPVVGSQGVVAPFLMRQYFLAIPKELEEAGKMAAQA